MDSFEVNKIIAAILVTILLVIGIGKISDIVFQTEKPNVEGYKVEITENISSTTAKSDNQIDISSLLALGNADHGKKVFKKCAACHSIAQNGGNKIGPKLYNVIGRPVASISDYKYSKAFSSYKKEWSFEELNGFLIKPAAWIKGNKMGFAGLKNEKDRASVIIYMNENSDNPKILP